MTPKMTASDIEKVLTYLFLGSQEMLREFEKVGVDSVETFSGAGLLSDGTGVVLSLRDGTEFRISIICSKPPRKI